MNHQQQTLSERRLSLLQEIAKAADEITRIDKELRTISGDATYGE
jgi:prefoldin subunit 5